MEVHKEKLANLCRICGQFIELKYGYCNAKSVVSYSELLLEYYHINVINESADVFPKQLCSNCNRKLVRLSNKTNGPTERLQSCMFAAHGENCTICVEKPKIRSPSLRISKLDVTMKQCNLTPIVIANQNSKTKRTYARQKWSEDSGILINEILFNIFDNDEWECFVYGKPCKLSYSIPEKLSEKDLPTILNFFTEKIICQGNGNYHDVIGAKMDIKLPFSISRYITDKNHQKLNPVSSYSIVRADDCSLFHDGKREMCLACHTLNKPLGKHKLNLGSPKSSTDGSSHTNYRYLTHAEKDERMANLQRQKRDLVRKVIQLSKKVSESIETDGVTIDNEDHEALCEIMNKSKSEPDFEEDTPQWLLWQQQKLQASKTDSRGMRWHPLIIRYGIMKIPFLTRAIFTHNYCISLFLFSFNKSSNVPKVVKKYKFYLL